MSTAKVLFPNDEEIYKIIKGLPNAEKLQDKIWESFCMENESIQSTKSPNPKQRRFQKHPTHFSEKEYEKDKDDADDSHSSLGSDDIAEVLFSKNKSEGRLKSQSAKYHRSSLDFFKDEDYDSLDEFCDVTFRNIGGVRHKPSKKAIEGMNGPSGSNKRVIVPSVVPKQPPKTMSLIKPTRKLKQSTASEKTTIEQIPEIEMETVPIVYDMNKDRRLKTVLLKCNNAMDDIRLLIDIGIPQPDGEEDYIRRKKRAVEFSNRFSRIYLYQINRLINDIRKLLRPHTSQKALHTASVKMNLLSRTNITQKFIQTLQLVQQSLQAYYNHLPSSIIVGVPEKLKDLLNLCNTICQLQNVIMTAPSGGGSGDKGANDMIADNLFTPFSTRSKSLLDCINEYCQIDSNISLIKSNRSKLSLLGYNVTKGKGMGDANSKMQLSVNSRFSMYGGGGNVRGCRKDAYWRSAIAALGKKHFNVCSRYKTAKFKHRPDVDRVQYTHSQHQPFQAYPINQRPGTNKTYSNGTTRSELVSTADGTFTNFHARQSEMSIANGKETREPTRRRGRTRYSLNDDNIKTVMQNVRMKPDGNIVADVAVGRAQKTPEEGQENSEDSSVDVPSRMRGNKNKPQQQEMNLCRNPKHIKSTFPRTPKSSPQQTPHLHFANELMGESSQCEMGPPTIRASPSAPAPTTTNILANTAKVSLCQLHQCQSFKYLQKNREEDKEFVTDIRACRSQPIYCQKCGSEEICHQTETTKDLVVEQSLPCAECRECQQVKFNDPKQTNTTSIDNNDSFIRDDDWSRLSMDCERTMLRLDERRVTKGKGIRGARRKGYILEEELECHVETEDIMGEERLMGGNVVAKDLARKLAGLVKKSVVKGEGRLQEGRDGVGIRGSGTGGDKVRDKVTVTSVTGAKNAKLICIRDDNSLTLDTTSDIAEEEPNENKVDKSNRLEYVHSQTQTELPQSVQQKQFGGNDRQSTSSGQKRKNVKVSRLPKAKVRRQLQMLDKEMSLNVIRYKLEYHKARKGNPMYKRADNGVQPWTLMEKVSDGILDHLLLSVAREIQVDDILVKLYESEFYAT